ncbi:apolipoprotein N-acyltransferase [Acaryochloris sp. IP29b_bin.137]|uniref:apolipoprotein N-acyltransferase n=1 Tax=Acaryochloris sp. IP29b_bin.137 TaxID=2969217 RepID=UPI0026076860|nr:apolipoprotein N-acyltransferase [Acaryochloris sp. IP29b_bin.137]
MRHLVQEQLKLKPHPIALGEWGLVFASGLVMGIIPAPVEAWWLAWIALVPLWITVKRTQGNIWRAMRLGFIWGLGYQGIALSWLTGLHPMTWMGLSWWTSITIAVVCWLFVTVYGALIATLWAGWMAWVTIQLPIYSRILAGTAAWTGLEWLWTQSPLWWTPISYTQSPANLVILHLGRLSGPTVIVAALVMVNGCFAESWSTLRHRWRYRSIAIALFITLHLLGWVLYAQPLTADQDTALTIGIVQGNIPTRIKLFKQGLALGKKNYESAYRQLADQGVDAVLTPEGAFPFLWQDQPPLAAAIQEKQVVVWLGSFMPENHRITQSLITVLPDGSVFSRYNKIKLVPLGEYIPFEPLLGQLFGRLTPVSAQMNLGNPNQQFLTPWGPAIAGICFDSVFPQLFQMQAARGGEFILTASNNDPYNTRMMAQHHAHDVMRAIETDRWVARSTNTGYSGVINPHGETLWRSAPQTFVFHAATVYRRQTQTLYVQWGNWFLPSLIGLSLIAGVPSFIQTRK